MFDIDVRLLEIIVKGVLFVEIDILEGVLIDVFMFVRKIDVVVGLNVVVGQTSLKLPFTNIIK